MLLFSFLKLLLAVDCYQKTTIWCKIKISFHSATICCIKTKRKENLDIKVIKLLECTILKKKLLLSKSYHEYNDTHFNMCTKWYRFKLFLKDFFFMQKKKERKKETSSMANWIFKSQKKHI